MESGCGKVLSECIIANMSYLANYVLLVWQTVLRSKYENIMQLNNIVIRVLN